ncbi:2Fe-2S iron-sulfur cluster-binding protein [Rhodanobacter sp. 115]|jgi:CDP-4-dehydro-6-deoxyglucose reductase|uniref:2Fe-2S iron-sulfur cluster binding domain-containing protein n=1 Tax=Rhodanobacter glycinis TaxID=582702 RepID=A0A5B9E148_9GAMM|nr:2Fe-2S iron-sulfur cluster-binding protein [Rhodanobacter glycinis]EIL87169.1 CDP-6-deoxy-delta-3,4-glucoseen reductase [Rhodanobacter sp. 115]QEE26013.1 2Fe-2S iron-sulfur cluster binding domain-containing protein [Rhodanobacter glycinis]
MRKVALSTECHRGDNACVFTVTLKSSGRHFDVAAGETVLEAAQRAGIALPYSCRAGVCGSCKATLLAGRCVYPRNPPTALDAHERAHHAVLLCQAVPASDLLLEAREVTSVEDIARRQLRVRVADKWTLAPDVTGLRLLPDEGVPRLRWLPGQYLDVLLEEGRRRPFSIANGPQADGAIELHVRHVAGGGFTSWVADRLQVGDTLRIEGPLGTLVAREDSERPMVFMAGGTGFAPVKAIVEHFIELGTRREMDVYWGARNAADLYLREEVEGWAARLPNLRFHPVLSEPDQAQCPGLREGLVHEAVLADHPDLSGHDVYMSGPPAMIDAARHRFTDAGLPDDRLYYDSFDYAPDVLAQIMAGRAGLHP